MRNRAGHRLRRPVLLRRHHSFLQARQSHQTTVTKLWPCRSRSTCHRPVLLAGIHRSQYRVETRWWEIHPQFNLDLVESLGCRKFSHYRDRCDGTDAPLQMIPILHLLGLGLLPRQYRKEAEQRNPRRQSPTVISNPRLQQHRFGV
jgi:hypothetical protein